MNQCLKNNLAPPRTSGYKCLSFATETQRRGEHEFRVSVSLCLCGPLPCSLWRGESEFHSWAPDSAFLSADLGARAAVTLCSQISSMIRGSKRMRWHASCTTLVELGGQHPKSGADSEAVGDFEDELWLMQNKGGQVHRGVSSRQLLPTRYGFSYL